MSLMYLWKVSCFLSITDDKLPYSGHVHEHDSSAFWRSSFSRNHKSYNWKYLTKKKPLGGCNIHHNWINSPKKHYWILWFSYSGVKLLLVTEKKTKQTTTKHQWVLQFSFFAICFVLYFFVVVVTVIINKMEGKIYLNSCPDHRLPMRQVRPDTQAMAEDRKH